MIHYQWLLFDADDTLFDYQRAETMALAQAFGQVGITPSPEDVATYRRINHGLWQALERGELTQDVVRVRRFELLFAHMGVALSPAAFSQTYVERLGDQTALIDGAQHVLDTLRGRFRLAIVTNGISQVQRSRLARSSIRDHIEALIISEDIGRAKPAPEFFDAAFERLGSPPRDVVMIVGDSLTSDMAGGAAYGLDTCWYNPARGPNTSPVTPTYEIARLPELLDLLG